MDISIRNAEQNDYNSLLPLFRQVHEFHVFKRPDLYKENSTPVEQKFFESQLIDAKQHIFVAAIGNDIVGVIVIKEEETTENSFVKARKVLVINSLCVAETHRKRGIGKKLTKYVLILEEASKLIALNWEYPRKILLPLNFIDQLG